MAVTFDASATSATTNNGTSPLAWAQTCGAGADWILAAFALDGGSGITPGNNPLTATYDSVSMTSELNWQSGGSGQTAGYLAVLALHNPTTGSSVNTSGSFTTTGLDCVIAGSASAISGGGTLRAPVHSDSNGAAAASGSITVTGTTNGSLVFVFVTNGSGGTAFTTGTSRFTNNHATGSGAAISANCATIAGTGGSITVNWTQNTDFYAAIAIEVLPPAGGGGAVAAPRQQIQLPRRRPARGQWRKAIGAAFVAVPAPRQLRPLPRRVPSRAVVRGSAPFGGFTAVPAPPQLRPLPRRVPSRAVVRGSAPFGGFVAVPAPPQLRPLPRRVPSRAVVGFVPVATVNAAPAVTGVTPPPVPHPQPRRVLARGQSRGIAGPGVPAVPPPRQLPPVPRRPPGRAYVQFRPVPATNAPPTAPPPRQQAAYPRRVPGRAVVLFRPVPGTVAAVPGVAVAAPLQLPATPRRRPSRALVLFVPVATVNNPHPPAPARSIVAAGDDDKTLYKRRLVWRMMSL